MAGPWERYAKPELVESGPWSKYSNEGIPTERKELPGILDTLETVIAGGTRPFKQATSTLMGLGVKGVESALGEKGYSKKYQEQVDKESAAYEQQYGKDPLARLMEFYTGTGMTAPIGGLIAAPLKAFPAAAPLAQSIASGGFKTGAVTTPLAKVALRSVGGGITGAASAGLLNPEDVGTGAAIGAAFPLVGAPLVSGAAKSLSYLRDLVGGNQAAVQAGKIARDTLGDQLPRALEVLKNAPEGITPAQALQQAGINADPFMALEAFAKNQDRGSWYRMLAESQRAGQLNQLSNLAGGSNQVNALNAQIASKNALTNLTTPMRDIELGAANQAGATMARLNPLIDQKQASMVSALQGQGQAATDAAQQTVLSRGGVVPPSLGGTGNPSPIAVPVPGLPRVSPSITTNIERAGESAALSVDMGAIKAQRQAERDFLVNQIGSLESHGLKPLNVDSIVSQIDSKLADPSIRSNPDLVKVLSALKDDFTEEVARNGGVADARALNTIRTLGINQRIDSILDKASPSTKEKVTAQIISSIKPAIDQAIVDAGGTGWTNYLKTFETGMKGIEQQRMAAAAMKMFEQSPEEFIKLVRGNNPKEVEKVFGKGSFDIIKQMGRQSTVLENVAGQLERDIAIKAQAKAGTGGLKRIMEEDQPLIRRIPAFFSKAATTTNMALDILENKVSQKIKTIFEEGFKSGKSTAEILETLPFRERNTVMNLLSNNKNWNASATTGAVQMSTPRNNLAPENRNALTQ